MAQPTGRNAATPTPAKATNRMNASFEKRAHRAAPTPWSDAIRHAVMTSCQFNSYKARRVRLGRFGSRASALGKLALRIFAAGGFGFGGAFGELALCITAWRTKARRRTCEQTDGRERNNDIPHFTSPRIRNVDLTAGIAQRTLHLGN
jgi:hypothetical protein